MKIKVSKQLKVLVLQIQFPLPTLNNIITLLAERKILLEDMLFTNQRKTEAILVLHLLMDKEDLEENMKLITRIPGTINLDEDALKEKNIIKTMPPWLFKSED